MIKVFDKHGFDVINICCPEYRMISLEIAEGATIFFHQRFVVLREILFSSKAINFLIKAVRNGFVYSFPNAPQISNKG